MAAEPPRTETSAGEREAEGHSICVMKKRLQRTIKGSEGLTWFCSYMLW